MKLTESKLKQMILEAIKNSKLQDFGIPTPDEKLRADLGDEMFDKIQAADPEQSEMFKQSFDPEYPMEVPRESLKSFMESYDFYLYESKLVDWMGPANLFMSEVYISNDKDHTLSLSYSVITNRITDERFIRYRYDYRKEVLRDPRSETGEGKIKISELFDYNIENEEDQEIMSSLIFLEIKEDLQKIFKEAGL